MRRPLKSLGAKTRELRIGILPRARTRELGKKAGELEIET